MPSSGPGRTHMAPTSANQIRINAAAGYLVISLRMVPPHRPHPRNGRHRRSRGRCNLCTVPLAACEPSRGSRVKKGMLCFPGTSECHSRCAIELARARSRFRNGAEDVGAEAPREARTEFGNVAVGAPGAGKKAVRALVRSEEH